jgi:outer membrane biosynthesis protein TonB
LQKNARKRKLTTAQKQEHKELAMERFESQSAKRERMGMVTVEADDAASSGSGDSNSSSESDDDESAAKKKARLAKEKKAQEKKEKKEKKEKEKKEKKEKEKKKEKKEKKKREREKESKTSKKEKGPEKKKAKKAEKAEKAEPASGVAASGGADSDSTDEGLQQRSSLCLPHPPLPSFWMLFAFLSCHHRKFRVDFDQSVRMQDVPALTFKAPDGVS